jgi:tRNA nucleotidyltransferase (CCA-adding enzyme)
MDFDCLGSLVLLKKIYPRHRLVRSIRIHPAARNLFDFYEVYFDFLFPKDLANEQIDNIIIVDTCMAERVKEYFRYIRKSTPEIRIIDHHPTGNCNILGASIDEGRAGANTSLVGKLAMERGIKLQSEEATIALTGIYADTGRLIYENVSREDFEVAAWLIDMGASLKLVKSFLETVKEEEQIAVMNRILMNKTERVIQGHSILFSFLELEENVSGLAAVVDKVMEIENPDAYFAVFFLSRTKTVLLIARSQKELIDLHYLLHVYGGGGHQFAASAKVNNSDGFSFFEELPAYLEKSLAPAARARDIMTRDVCFINENKTLIEASILLEEINHTGVPVLNDSGDIAGFLHLKDIMKGRKAGVMQSPVRAYMSKPAITAESSLTMREVERLFYRHHIGHLPVTENNRLAGILTRYDYLQYQKHKGSAE